MAMHSSTKWIPLCQKAQQRSVYDIKPSEPPEVVWSCFQRFLSLMTVFLVFGGFLYDKMLLFLINQNL